MNDKMNMYLGITNDEIKALMNYHWETMYDYIKEMEALWNAENDKDLLKHMRSIENEIMIIRDYRKRLHEQ